MKFGPSPPKAPDAIRIGVLGAARITPEALLGPARHTPSVVIVAVAARDVKKARAFAKKHGIPKVFDTYLELIQDPDIDAVYNPLPNGLHCEWTVKALEHGKHVLCEKPLASNADEAEVMRAAAAKSGKVMMEAFHNHYHPMNRRMREILRSGEIGTIRRAEARMTIPGFISRRIFDDDDIRFNFDLAGGILMDGGCYTVHFLRFVMGSEPVEVTMAKPRLIKPETDEAMEAEMTFADGAVGHMYVDFRHSGSWTGDVSLRVIGDKGELCTNNFMFPTIYHSLRVSPSGKPSRTEKVYGDEHETTYWYQLQAFVLAVRTGDPVETDGADAVKNMRVIDMIYDKAGLKRRGPQPVAVPQ